VLAAAKSHAAGAWLSDIDVVVVVRTIACSTCATVMPEAAVLRLDSERHIEASQPGTAAPTFAVRSGKTGVRARAERCALCGTRLPVTSASARTFVPAAVRIQQGDRWDWAPMTSAIADLINESAEADEELFAATFTVAGGRPVPWVDASSPRQLRVLSALILAARSELTDLDGRAVPARASSAVSTLVALLVSAMLPLLTRAATWSPSTARVAPALSRGRWSIGASYAEVGGRQLEATWSRRVREALQIIEAALPGRVDVRRGDARRLPDQDESFDLVVWDPPFYDNVDYDALARPFQQVLQYVAPTHPDLAAPPARDLPGRFDAHSYEGDIRAMAREARRLVASSGHVGVWWISRAADQLQEFVDLIADIELELRMAVWIDTERRLPNSSGRRGEGRPRTYLLVFQKTTAVTPVDAAVVLALADAERPSLYDGVAAILETEYSTGELDAMLPPELRGEAHERLVEFVATHSRPDELLSELGRRALQAHAETLGVEAGTNADVKRIARSVLAGLGFSVPRAPDFSVEFAGDGLQRLAGDIRLARSVPDAKHAFDEAERLVLRTLRLATLSWARLVPGDWQDLALRIVERARGRSPRDVNLLTLGDWKSVFDALPKELAAHEPPIGPLFEQHRRALKALKATASLDLFVKVRNRLAHPDDRETSLNEVLEAVDAMATLLRNLSERQVLPVVLDPQEERRDRWGRLLLVALDGRGRTRDGRPRAGRSHPTTRVGTSRDQPSRGGSNSRGRA